jgi:hypothetical protein
MAAVLQFYVVVVGHRINAMDYKTFIKQEFCNVESDESGGAGYQDTSQNISAVLRTKAD